MGTKTGEDLMNAFDMHQRCGSFLGHGMWKAKQGIGTAESIGRISAEPILASAHSSQPGMEIKVEPNYCPWAGVEGK